MAGDKDKEAAVPVAFDSAKVEVFGDEEELTKLSISGRLVDDPDIHFEAKVYDVGSSYGIADGRISKLSVHDMCDGGKTLFEYSRGWPEDHLGVPQVPAEGREREILQTIVEGFPEPQQPEMKETVQEHGPSLEEDGLEL